MILIFSASWDEQAPAVLKELQSKGADSALFITDHYSKQNYIRLLKGKISVVINGKSVGIDELTAVWARHPFEWIYGKELLKDDEIFLANELRREEVNNLVKGFIGECRRRNIFVINNFGCPIEYKLPNLLRAQEAGFTVPKTIIANSQADFKSLQHDQTQYIIKPFVSRTGFRDKVINKDLMLITGEDFYKKAAGVNPLYPVQLQEVIAKQFDLRITVAGRQVYACVLYSQENPETRLDMGAKLFIGMKYGTFKLPVKIKNLCLKLCRQNGLNHGVIDMALDTKGRYVYFEINPYGEYLWLEKETGLKISKGMANLLINPEKYRLV